MRAGTQGTLGAVTQAVRTTHRKVRRRVAGAGTGGQPPLRTLGDETTPGLSRLTDDFQACLRLQSFVRSCLFFGPLACLCGALRIHRNSGHSVQPCSQQEAEYPQDSASSGQPSSQQGVLCKPQGLPDASLGLHP